MWSGSLKFPHIFGGSIRWFWGFKKSGMRTFCNSPQWFTIMISVRQILNISPHIREEEILHQLSLVVYRVLYISHVVIAGFLPLTETLQWPPHFWIPKSHPGCEMFLGDLSALRALRVWRFETLGVTCEFVEGEYWGENPPPRGWGNGSWNPHDLPRFYTSQVLVLPLLGGGKSHMIFWNFHPGKLGKWNFILTNIFQRGWNHQLDYLPWWYFSASRFEIINLPIHTHTHLYWYCWWFRNPAITSWGNGTLSQCLRRVWDTSKWWLTLGFFFHQQYQLHPEKPKVMEVWSLWFSKKWGDFRFQSLIFQGVHLPTKG